MSLLSKKLKKLRMQRGFTMREVADGIAVPLTTYREWEYGRAIRGENILKVAVFFGVSLEELIGHKDSVTLSIEQRLNRIKDDLSSVLEEIGKQKK
jgi:transcriptional regulator with XRE-family HTH domain